MLTFEEIKELIGLVAERRLRGLAIEREGFRLKIKGIAPLVDADSAAIREASPLSSSIPGSAEAGMAASSTPRAAGSEAAAPGESAAPAGSEIINSPIVGTFYRQPSPEADPYVEIGDRVKKGMVLCIVEAMKLMNEIESDHDGVVVEIYPKSAQPVEYGEPLFAIRPD